jgi:hypothetical protein
MLASRFGATAQVHVGVVRAEGPGFNGWEEDAEGCPLDLAHANKQGQGKPDA